MPLDQVLAFRTRIDAIADDLQKLIDAMVLPAPGSAPTLRENSSEQVPKRVRPAGTGAEVQQAQNRTRAIARDVE
jgi:hypothetical protein